MLRDSQRFGLSCALATPFRSDGSVDLPRLTTQAGWCLQHGCSSVTLFGTTGEGASLGLSVRREILATIGEAGIDFGSSVVVGVAASSLEDALDQARLAHDRHCRAILLAPPFYFKGVSDDGLFSWFSGFLDRLGDTGRSVILYNIPSVTAVPLSVSLIGRLRSAYPQHILGVKDSSGEWTYAEALLAEHRDLVILIGDERQLAQAVRIGAQGAISGMANIQPARLLRMIESGEPDAVMVRAVDELLKYPVTPAVKALIADRTRDPAWAATRAPLRPLPQHDAEALSTVLRGVFAAQDR